MTETTVLPFKGLEPKAGGNSSVFNTPWLSQLQKHRGVERHARDKGRHAKPDLQTGEEHVGVAKQEDIPA